MGFLDEMSSFFSVLRKMKDPEMMEQMLKFQKSCSEFMMENDLLKDEIRKLKEKISILD